MQSPVTLLNEADIFAKIQEQERPYLKKYHAMFSSWLGGITTNPRWMILPIDDHMVHRGDGVFEAMKFTQKKIYALEPHLDRLERSAAAIALPLPYTRKQIRDLICATIQVASSANGDSPKLAEGLVRLFVSRGPGGFTTNPYETIGSQLYIVVTSLAVPSAEKYENGASLKISRIPIKEGLFSTVKSCNYLPNVLMKKEALDAGVDFTVSLDAQGNLGESSTENCAIILNDEFLVPHFKQILRGVTLVRAMHLAQILVQEGQLKAVRHADISQENLAHAQEILMLGTTMDVLAITNYEGRKVGSGKPGPIFYELKKLIERDQLENHEMVTECESLAL